MKEILEKLNAFLKAKMITEKQFEVLAKVNKELSKFNPEKVDTFITHLAMTFNRMNNNQVAEKMEDFLITEINSHQKITFANSFIHKIEKWSGQKFEANEIPYLQLHLLNIGD